MTSADRDPFIGREREMAELAAALEDSSEGRGRMVMLVGEPGIGKTRSAEELAAIAKSQGGGVLWGRCPEESGAPPYWPWVQIIRSLISDQDPDAVRQALGSGAGVISEIVAEISGVVTDPEPPPSIGDPDAARFRLYDAITSFLKRSAQDRPLLLILDNLHWSDGSSLRLLEFLAQELSDSRLLILGTYRNVDVTREHPLFDTLGELTRQRLFSRVLLRGLSPDEVGRVIESAGRAVPPADLIGNVHTQTEGNPLFVGEMARFLAQEGLLGRGGPTTSGNLLGVRLPEGIREVIGRRLNRLSGSANDVLMAAAIIGRDFTLSQLLAVIPDTTRDGLIEILEEAMGANVVNESPDEVGVFQFTHALIQQTLRDGLTLTRRVRMHARVAEALEELYGGEAEDHAAELALHFEQAQTVLGADRMVGYSLMAGNAAIDAFAYDEALIHFERAWEERRDEQMDDQLADILAGLARAENATPDLERRATGVQHALEAFNHYANTDQRESAIAVAAIHFMAIGADAAHELNRKAIGLIDDETPAASFLLSQRAMQLQTVGGDFEEARHYSDRAIQLARSNRDQASEALALSRLAIVEFQAGRYGEALAACLATIEPAQSAGERVAEINARVYAAWVLYREGKTSESIEHGDAAYSLALASHDSARIAQSVVARVLPRLLAGRWSEIDEILSAAGGRTARQLISFRFLVAVQRGGESVRAYADESWELITKSKNSYGFGAPELQNSIRSLSLGLRRAGLSTELQRAVIFARSHAPTSPLGPDALAMTEALHGLHFSEFSVLPASYEILREVDLKATNVVVVQTLLGEIAAKIGKIAEAEGHFELAIEHCREAGWTPEIAWAEYHYTEMLIERDGPGDKEKVVKLQDEAVAIALELGMAPLEERLLDLRGKAASMSAQAPAYPDRLTKREVEVLRLIAAGKTNREIGEDLFISENTVIRHVSNIFGKAGANNRTEAGIYAERQGLTGDDSAQN